jgi:hypothetical protein
MTPDDLSQLVPAFVGAALVIVVVAGGILIFVWRQYPPPPGNAAGPGRAFDPERVSVKRGLSMSGIVVLALGLSWLGVAMALGQAAFFGPASLLVPVAVSIDGLLFLGAARAFPTAAQIPGQR